MSETPSGPISSISIVDLMAVATYHHVEELEGRFSVNQRFGCLYVTHLPASFRITEPQKFHSYNRPIQTSNVEWYSHFLANTPKDIQSRKLRDGQITY